MDKQTDQELIGKARDLFGGFDVTVSGDPDDVLMTDYNKIVGELLRRGYSPVITIDFKK